MIKVKKFFALIMLCVMLTASAVFVNGLTAKADTGENNLTENTEVYGLYTKLTISLERGDGTVSAVAYNQFTLFNSEIKVFVYLYSSDTYQESYQNMTEVTSSYSSDLNMGDRLYATAKTNGAQKYWKARMRFKRDKDDWAEQVTDTIFING